MTVAELIEKLQRFGPDETVVIAYPTHNHWNHYHVDRPQVARELVQGNRLVTGQYADEQDAEETVVLS